MGLFDLGMRGSAVKFVSEFKAKGDYDELNKIVSTISNIQNIIGIIIIILFTVIKRYIKTPEGRRKLDELKLKLPIIKNLYKKLIIFNFSR